MPIGMNVFTQDPFSSITLTTAVERNPFQPSGLGELNLFTPNPIRTTMLTVEQRQGKLTLIPFSERGTEGKQRTTEQRQARFFKVPRLMHDDTLYANEIQDIRAFGSETEMMQLEAEVARRLAGPTGLLASMEYTWEYQRLAAVQGLCLDFDGTVKYNWFDEFGITQEAEVNFNLAALTPNSLRPICNAIIRDMARKGQGAFIPNRTRVMALCDDTFFDAFVNHPDVIRTYVNWADAVDIRSGSQGAAFSAFEFGGITWLNYRGSDDNSEVAIAAGKVKFFPVNAPGVFEVAYAPGESFEWVNTPGKPVYVIPILDEKRKMWWKQEVYSYPLHICTRPEMLLRGHL